MSTTVMSVLFSGVVAALVTFALNVWHAGKQQQRLEEWENRKYEANQRHYSLRAFTELFYAARTEVYFLGLDLTNTEAYFAGTLHATELLLLQNNPQITAHDLTAQKAILTEQHRQQMISRKVTRIDQYNNSVKAIIGRARAEVSVASHYLARDLQERLESVLKRIGDKVEVGTPADVAAVLRDFDNIELEFRQIQKGILGELKTLVKKQAAGA